MVHALGTKGHETPKRSNRSMKSSFNTLKATVDNASMWLDRLEGAAREDHRLDQDYDFTDKLMQVVDNNVLRWMRSMDKSLLWTIRWSDFNAAVVVMLHVFRHCCT